MALAKGIRLINEEHNKVQSSSMEIRLVFKSLVLNICSKRCKIKN